MPLLIRLSVGAALCASLLGAPGCSSVDLSTALEVTDVTAAWYDDGLADAPGRPENGWNHIVPTLSFRLRNRSDSGISAVQLTVSFWGEGADGEFDSVLTRGIGGEALGPGQSTDLIEVRGSVGYNLEGRRADLFMHSGFKDATAKLFARRAGRIVPLGEYQLERRLVSRETAVTGLP